MLPYLRDHHADPGRVHSEGHVTRVAIEEAREAVAALIGARPREVVFTSSGTEAVNAAVFGAAERARAAGRPVRIVASAVEHSSVLDAARRVGEVALAPVDRRGRVDPADVLQRVDETTALVCVQLANHEVGTLQPAAEIAAAARDRGVLVLVDACAALGQITIDFAGLGCDLLAVSAHKAGGPKGAGALVVRRGLRLEPLMVGGAQERGRRGGIENVPAVVGFGAAATEVATSFAEETARAWHATERVLSGAPRTVSGVEVYGDADNRLPGLVCLGVEGVEAEPILLALDQRGISVHSGSSCSSETLEPSPVLEAMGVDAEHSLRVSVGWSTTDDDVDAFLAALPPVVEDLRALRG